MELLAVPTARRSRRGEGSSRILLGVLVVALILGAGSLSAQQAVPSREYQVKAVFLFNFAMFVDWPSDAFPDTSAPFVIGVLGNDPFGPYLDEVVRGEEIGKRRVEVRRYRAMEEVGLCHILYVGQGGAAPDGRIRESLGGRRVLTVGESDQFLRDGGVIAFAERDGKIRLRINTGAAKASSLTISSKLLRAAEIFDDGGR